MAVDDNTTAIDQSQERCPKCGAPVERGSSFDPQADAAGTIICGACGPRILSRMSPAASPRQTAAQFSRR